MSPDKKNDRAPTISENLSIEEREELLLTGKVVKAELVRRPLPGNSIRSFTTPVPEEYKNHAGEILEIRGEEEALVWLWARPELFPWPRPVEWLFSPPVGNTGMDIGDLWGVDAEGELLIIENKLGRGGKRSDPFSKLCKHWEKHKIACSIASIRENWQWLLEKETQRVCRLQNDCRDKRGLLPHSSNCACLHRWPELTCKMQERIRNKEYKNNVLRYLDKRGAGEGRPHYCGLVVKITNGINPPGFNFCKQSIRDLRKEVDGADRVHWFEVCAHIRPSKSLEIVAKRIPIEA